MKIITPENETPPYHMRIWTLRHEERYQSPVFETSLTYNGFHRAKLLARTLDNMEITHIYCSPFVRTLQTIAPFLLFSSIKVNLEPAVSEFIQHEDFAHRHTVIPVDTLGEHFENMSFVNELYQPIYNESKITYPESLEHLEKRIHAFLDHLSSNHRPHDRILVVSHKGPINVMHSFHDSRDYPVGFLKMIGSK